MFSLPRVVERKHAWVMDESINVISRSAMSLMAVAAYGLPVFVTWPASASAAEISRSERLPPLAPARANGPSGHALRQPPALLAVCWQVKGPSASVVPFGYVRAYKTAELDDRVAPAERLTTTELHRISAAGDLDNSDQRASKLLLLNPR